MINDTLSDMLVRIKNAQTMGKKQVDVVDSKLNRSVCDVLVDEGFVESYDAIKVEEKPFLKINLKYYMNKPVIQMLKRVSKSSLRVYKKCRDVPKIIDGFGVMVMSTPKGVMSHLKAREANLGGEALFIIN
ncbi:MAG TPA: 30S ribosomal protein S8 [Gammaproteobacteria bacterium]|nr:30S ribosomal protein S8 [Gammaproteobacteria bacterium]